jgi:hypothetical protein
VAAASWNDGDGSCSVAYAHNSVVAVVDVYDREDGRDAAIEPISPVLQEAIRATASLDGTGAAVRAMAIVEHLTGERLDQRIMDGAWPVVTFALPEEPERSVLAGVDAELAAALDRASPVALLLARNELLDAVLARYGWDKNAALQACRPRLLAPELSDAPTVVYDLIQETGEAYRLSAPARFSRTNPAWQRMQAGSFLHSTAVEFSGSQRWNAWWHASAALGPEWPTVRARQLAILQASDGPPA